MRRRCLLTIAEAVPSPTTLFARTSMRCPRPPSATLWTAAAVAPPPRSRPTWSPRPTAATPPAFSRGVAASAASRADETRSDDASSPAPSDLRSVPGVGAKTELLLLARGIGCVADLSRVFHGEAAASTSAMVSYLQVREGKGKTRGREGLRRARPPPADRPWHARAQLRALGGGRGEGGAWTRAGASTCGAGQTAGWPHRRTKKRRANACGAPGGHLRPPAPTCVRA